MERSQIVEDEADVEVIVAENLLLDLQNALVELLGSHVVAFEEREGCQALQGIRGRQAVLAGDPLRDGQGLRAELYGARVVVLIGLHSTGPGEEGRVGQVVRPVGLSRDLQRAVGRRLGAGEIVLGQRDVAQGPQRHGNEEVLGAQGLLPDAEGSFRQAFRVRIVGPGVFVLCQVVQRLRHGGVLLAGNLLGDRERALEQGLRPGVIAPRGTDEAHGV